ncbi:MAG: hypothetical protein WC838_05050 [Candidatus Margulisiibacteriota bacterium]
MNKKNKELVASQNHGLVHEQKPGQLQKLGKMFSLDEINWKSSAGGLLVIRINQYLKGEIPWDSLQKALKTIMPQDRINDLDFKRPLCKGTIVDQGVVASLDGYLTWNKGQEIIPVFIQQGPNGQVLNRVSIHESGLSFDE